MASISPRAASARLAARVRFWITVRTGLRASGPRSKATAGTRSTPWMRTISSTRSALPSTSPRQDGTVTFKVSPVPATENPSARENPLALRGRHVEAGEALGLRKREIDHAFLVRDFSGQHDLRRLAAAHLQDELGRHLQARHREGRIDAALEARARVRIDAELAAGLGDIDRHPQRRFDQHVGGRIRAAGRLAAHDAGERLRRPSRRRSRTSSRRARRCARRAR